ncbi:hypothetical protein [Pyxidicoccus caerfyrddinensis]|uniref:hypothetical protein n=1 Tax=Pyxidicoccus caerfyrddinensis TaxID=2709663 RepID=UPI0013DD0572|nr:hypothetical protein [Pyxidicoccus caerfyrddinensis]
MRSELEALADAGGAEWEAPVFEPAAPTSSAPPEGTAARGRAHRKVAVAGTVVVAVAAVLALLRQSPPPPDAPGLPAPVGIPYARVPDVAPPSTAPPPVAEVPSSAPVAPAQKEAPTVSAPKPPPRQPPPKQPRLTARPVFTPEFLARCAGLTLAAAAELGCPASQVRPERERCPEEAVDFMDRMRAGHEEEFSLTLDVMNQPGGSSQLGVYRTGKYVGAFNGEKLAIHRGWRFEGQIWTEGKKVVGRFTKMFPPAGAADFWGDPLPPEVPVCIVLGHERDNGIEKDEGSKPGAVILSRAVTARFIKGEWPQP